jgi:hypothetical protein
MLRKSALALSILTALAVTTAALAAQDWRTMSAAEFTPKELRNYGAFMKPEVSINDAEFYSAEQLPKAEELSATERFMVAGGTGPGGERGDWMSEVTMVCRAYESVHHTIPAQLTPAVLADVFQVSETEAATYSYFRNPITGDWLRTDAKEPSAGDLYLRRLTTEEAIKIANSPGGNGNLYMIMHNQPFNIDGRQEYEHLIGDVWYCRAYGEGGRVILTWTPMMSAPGK